MRHELDVGAIVKLELQLPSADALAQSRHHVSAQVVRRTETGYDMTLLEPSPELIHAISAVIMISCESDPARSAADM